MSARDLQATIILFDTCVSTLTVDFSPNRFEAQRQAVLDIARSIIRGNQESVVGFGVLSCDCHIILTLTRKDRQFDECITSAGRSGTIVEFERSVRAALFELERRPSSIPSARLIVLLSTAHTLTTDRAAVLADAVRGAGASVDLVIFGTDVTDQSPFDAFISAVGARSRIIRVPRAVSLTEHVRQSLEGFGRSRSAFENEVDLQLSAAVAFSYAEEQIGSDFDDEEPLPLLAGDQLPLELEEPEAVYGGSKRNNELIAVLENREQLRQVLATIPGVNVDDPRFDPANWRRTRGSARPKPRRR
jgi:hypothetical protein